MFASVINIVYGQEAELFISSPAELPYLTSK